MKITASGKEVSNGANLLNNITKSDTVSVSITKRKKGNVLTLSAGKDGSTVRVFNYSADTGEKPGKFTVSNSVLKGVLNNRGVVTLTHKKGENIVKFVTTSGKKYSGELTIVPYEKIEVTDESDTLVTLSEEVHAALDSALSRVQIENVFSNDPMYVFIKMSSKGLSVVCFDQFHIAYYRDKKIKSDDIIFSLPVTTIAILQKLSNDKPYKLGVNESTVIAANKYFDAALPIVQSEQEASFEMVTDLMKKVPKSPDSTITLSRNTLVGALTAMMNLYEDGAPVTLTYGKKGLNIKIDTNFGKLSETIEVTSSDWKKDSEYSVIPYVMQDILRVVKGDSIVLNFVDDWIVYIRDEKSFYSCSLL